MIDLIKYCLIAISLVIAIVLTIMIGAKFLIKTERKEK